MSCGEVLELIEAHIDRDLGDDEAAAVELHLATCAPCSTQRRAAKEIRCELRALPHFDAPNSLLDRLRREARSDARTSRLPRRPISWVRRPLAAGLAAAAVLAIAVGALLLRTNSAPVVPVEDRAAALRAASEARFAFAVVAEATRRAGVELQHDVLERRVIAPTVRGLAKSLVFGPGAPPARPSPPKQTPSPSKEA